MNTSGQSVRRRRRSGKPTLADVARSARVSAITVSRALRDPASVSAELRERIDRAVREFGYVPDSAARALASARTNVIGIVIPSVTNSVFTDVLQGIYDAIDGTPYQVQLGNSNYSTLQEEALFRLFVGQSPAALLVTGLGQSRESWQLLRDLGCPVVQIMELGQDPVDMLVGFSHEQACAAATRNLIDNGYRRIGFLAAQMDPRTRMRLAGYAGAMREADLHDERLIVTTPKPSSVTLGGELCAELLSRLPDADAIQTNNDDIAIGAMFECRRRRMRIPEDFGISGFNDLEIMSVAHPSMTSVRTYRYEMGRLAIEMLVDSIAGKRPEDSVVDLGFKLMVRESTDRTGLSAQG
jgi:LacI family transcriptional regulator, gluconate utilization system Gnt-I transcriptional repressor